MEKPAPFLKYKFSTNEETGRQIFDGIELSDGTQIHDTDFELKLLDALKRSTGSENPAVSDLLISAIAYGMSSNDEASRYNKVATILSELKPEDEIETMLLGQFIALQESGFKCLRQANHRNEVFNLEKFGSLAVKLLRCANETAQTLMKYKNEGKQQLIVANVSGGQAIIANEVST